MAIKVGINGFGRMGRLVVRAAWGAPDISFVQINEPAADPATLAHLLNFDSVHGRWDHQASALEHGLAIDDTGDCLAIGSSTGNVWVSENGGDEWVQVSSTLPQIYAVRWG